MSTDTTVSSVVGEATKALPPVVVSTATYLGFTLQEWVYIATITYTVIQIAVIVYDKIIKPLRERRKRKDG